MLPSIVVTAKECVYILFDFGDAGGIFIYPNGHGGRIPPNTPWIRDAAAFFKAASSLAQSALQIEDAQVKQQALQAITNMVQLGNANIREVTTSQITHGKVHEVKSTFIVLPTGETCVLQDSEVIFHERGDPVEW